jgi:hypothetical protein
VETIRRKYTWETVTCLIGVFKSAFRTNPHPSLIWLTRDRFVGIKFHGVARTQGAAGVGKEIIFRRNKIFHVGTSKRMPHQTTTN